MRIPAFEDTYSGSSRMTTSEDHMSDDVLNANLKFPLVNTYISFGFDQMGKQSIHKILVLM